MELIKPHTDAKINECIAQIASVSNKLPGVCVVHNLHNWRVVWMCEQGLNQLGITRNEVTNISSEEYHSRFFNPEDAKDYVPKIMGLLERNAVTEMVTYFQQVRLARRNDWTWYMSSTRILLRDEENEPLLAITTSLPIDSMHHMTTKAARILEENNFLRSNFAQFARLSERERQVLKMLAMGKSSAHTAAELFITVNTVESHRKNVRQKLQVNSFFELTQYARAFDLI